MIIMDSVVCTQIDVLVAKQIMHWEDSNIVNGEIEMAYHNPFDFEPPRYFSPTRSEEHAMEAAMRTDLFEHFALHAGVGTYNGKMGWYVSEIDSRGVLQGYVAAGTPALAVTQALLKQAGVVLTEEQQKVLTTY